LNQSFCWCLLSSENEGRSHQCPLPNIIIEKQKMLTVGVSLFPGVHDRAAHRRSSAVRSISAADRRVQTNE
jgi:hypothetical protein